MKKELAALAVLYLVAHLLYLPPSLEDIDSINFALGVRDFDVARHQPHPPGYPVFIAMAKGAAALLGALGVNDPVPRALALLSAVSATALIPVLFSLFRRLGADAHTAWWAMAVAVCSPLLWFTALRPLSDLTGLAMAAAAQVCLLNALIARGLKTPGLQEEIAPHGARDVGQGSLGPGRQDPKVGPGSSDPGRQATRSFSGSPVPRLSGSLWLVLGAALCGLTAGVRIQTVMLMAPLLLAVLIWPRSGLSMRSRALALVAAMAGALAWGIPLLAANGGLAGYLTALGTQAGEDFSGVVMLWTTRTSRAAADAVLNSFVWPWRQYRFGVLMVALAAIGAARLGWQTPRALVLATIAFLPYAVFHLLFHETATMRYALPLILPVALLAAIAIAAVHRRALTIAAVTAVTVALVTTVPATRAYAHDGSPAFRTLRALSASVGRPPSPAEAAGRGSLNPVLGLHAAMRRIEEWQHNRHGYRVLHAPHGREWLALVEHWRAQPLVPAVFLADPRRTDLALFDPHARTREASNRWTLPVIPFLAGTRPGDADGYYMRPPGWMLDKGWALTAEVAGVTARDRLGPHVEPSTAWVRARATPADLIVGGRQVGGAAPARLTLTVAGRAIETWDVTARFFVRQISLPGGSLGGAGYLPLRLSASAADGSGRPVDVKLEQFDLQSDGNVMFGYVEGWYEPEYNPTTARSWHWMSERGRLWIRPVGRDVTLILSGESPLKYFDEAPQVKVLAGGTEVARFAPASDFDREVTIPANALAAASGVVTIETNLWFTPAQRGESADQRHLALRIYSVAVK